MIMIETINYIVNGSFNNGFVNSRFLYQIVPVSYASMVYQVGLVASSTTSRQDTNHGLTKFTWYAVAGYQIDTVGYLLYPNLGKLAWYRSHIWLVTWYLTIIHRSGGE